MAVAAHIEPARLAAARPMLSVVLPAHDEAGVIERHAGADRGPRR